jgi:hypothetical protein
VGAESWNELPSGVMAPSGGLACSVLDWRAAEICFGVNCGGMQSRSALSCSVVAGRRDVNWRDPPSSELEASSAVQWDVAENCSGVVWGVAEL